jgi:hypothetical protein
MSCQVVVGESELRRGKIPLDETIFHIQSEAFIEGKNEVTYDYRV